MIERGRFIKGSGRELSVRTGPSAIDGLKMGSCVMNDAKSAAAKRAEERQQSYKRALKEREEIVRKERAHTQKLRELRLAKEAEEKGKA